MAQDLVAQQVSPLPAPMPVELGRALSTGLNKLDQSGSGFSIALDDAPPPAVRAALERRHAVLAGCLIPAGKLFIARRIGEMSNMMRKRTRSQREADHAFERSVNGLADLPVFAIEQACDDFEKGAYGDGWFPDLSDLRPHALTKLQPVAAERRNLAKLLTAQVRQVKADPVRKSKVLEQARSAIKEMRQAGLKAEERRAGRIIEDKSTKKPETEAEMFARLQADAAKPIAPLSASGRRAARLPEITEDDHPQSAFR